jgi:hypothetical protein
VLADGQDYDFADEVAAIELVRFMHDQFTRFGTDRTEVLDDRQMALVRRTTRKVLQRLGLELNVGWRDFSHFHAQWGPRGATHAGGWAARRAMVEEELGPLLRA